MVTARILGTDLIARRRKIRPTTLKTHYTPTTIKGKRTYKKKGELYPTTTGKYKYAGNRKFYTYHINLKRLPFETSHLPKLIQKISAAITKTQKRHPHLQALAIATSLDTTKPTKKRGRHRFDANLAIGHPFFERDQKTVNINLARYQDKLQRLLENQYLTDSEQEISAQIEDQAYTVLAQIRITYAQRYRS